MKRTVGLDRYAVSPCDAIRNEIASWRTDPELAKLVSRLSSMTDLQQYLDAYAEVMVARVLLQNGCEVRVEVPTENGRTADFEATRGNDRLFIHVKRLNEDSGTTRQISVSKRTGSLETIPRPLVVGVSFRDDLSNAQMQRFVRQARSFIERADVGSKTEIKGDDGETLGSCDVLAEWSGQHVQLAKVLPAHFVDDNERFRKLLSKAYHQFMPGAENVIAVTSSCADDMDFETALLGATYERWDGPPPRGRVVECGRHGDGFWSDEKHPDSSAAAFFQFSRESDEFRSRLWVRPGPALSSTMQQLLGDLFASGPSGPEG